MALTPASILADYSSGIGTQGATLKVNTNEKRVGIGTTNPQGTLQVGTAITMGSGIVTATSFDASTASFSGNVSVGGTLTYEDVTSVDSVGIVTARSGVHIPNGDIGIGTDDTSLGKAVFFGSGGGNGQGPILSLLRHSDTPATNDRLGSFNFYGKDSDDNTVNYKSVYTRIVDPTSGSATGQLCIGSDNSNDGRQVIIDADGSVGIGTDDITEKLHVVGDARVTGILTVGTASLTLDGATGNVTGASLHDTQISAINTSIVGTGTTVDVFVYDTRKDSDGGAWRKRTQHTSWYNETLNTATRGSRREFPAVAVIVAEANQVTIYDGDDPDLPMWMVFNESSNASAFNLLGYSTRTSTAVAALNAEFMFCSTGNQNQTYFNLISDYGFLIYDGGSTVDYYNGNIGQRNDGLHYRGQSVSRVSGGIVNRNVNDVAMTVLPNAPIDSATGLPVPTIAVGTDAVLSVIKDDGTIVDYTGFGPIHKTEINSNYVYSFVHTSGNDYVFKSSLLSADGVYTTNITAGSGGFYANSINSIPKLKNMTVTDVAISSKDNTLIRSGNDGIEIFDGNVTTINSSQSITPFAYISKDYNTGYMVGDIKGAFLSDISTTNVTGSNLIDVTAASWSTFNGSGTVSNPSTGVIQIVDSDGNYVAYQDVTSTVVGKQYILTYNTTAARELYIEIRDTSAAVIANGNQFNYTGTYTGPKFIKFTATTTTTRIMFSDGSGGALTVSATDLQLRLAEADRSLNNNPLQVYGTITKSAVAGSGDTAAELVAYSGFSGSNYLEQPHHSGLEVGTGDFYVMGWFKGDDSTFNSPFQISSPNTDGNGNGSILLLAGPHTNNGLRFYTRNNSTGGWQQNTNGVPFADDNSTWNFVCCLRRSGVKYIYMNGADGVNAGTHAEDLTETDSIMRLGCRSDTAPGSASPWTGSLSLWRFGQGAPSAEQVKKMYEDERYLFQENAKATLYGSSDAVTALGYDDATELLHVGTSSGRSDFRGLRRINNTTTAVTTAISASNDLVAEE